MAVIIYTRTSTSQQELGHQAQFDACVKWAESQDLHIKAVFSETISGAKPLQDRRQLANAINSLSKGDVLVVYRRDRLGRDLINNAVCERFVKRKGASIHSLDVGSTNTAEGALLATLLDAFAQYERAVIAMRVNAVIQSKKDRGLCYGSPKLGKQTIVDNEGIKRHIEDEEENAKIDLVRSWRAEGMTFKEIRNKCDAEGIPSRSGGVPSESTIHSWCEGVEIPEKVKQAKAKEPSKRGRAKGTRGSRTLDKNPELKCVLIQCLKANMKQAEIVRTLASNGITTATGKAYRPTQVRRFISYIIDDGLIA